MTFLERVGKATGLHHDYPLYAEPQRRPARRPAARPVAVAPSVVAVDPVPPVNLTALLWQAVDLAGGVDRFAVRCRVANRDDVTGGRQLLVPPPPWRGRLRLLYAVDPNPGPDGETRRVLLPVNPAVETCHAAAAASFGVAARNYQPVREV